jgi:hypothetical protein
MSRERKIGRRQASKEILLVVGGLALLALGADGCEEPGGMDSPAGPVYWSGGRNDPTVAPHEKCHDQLRRQYQKKYGFFEGNRRYYEYYLADLCREETRCGEPEHYVCRNR